MPLGIMEPAEAKGACVTHPPFRDRETYESKLVKDADNLEWMLSLKEQVDIGNKRAWEWLPSAQARLKTKEGIE